MKKYRNRTTRNYWKQYAERKRLSNRRSRNKKKEKVSGRKIVIQS